MSRRRSSSAAFVPAASRSLCAVLALTATACTSPVAVDPPEGGDPDTVPVCRLLVTDLPDEVEGQEARDVEPDDAVVAAWGDPPIVLRCGVERPPWLQPTSFCFVVNDVGWYAEDAGGPLDGTTAPQGEVVFTTIGRSSYVEVTVPDDYPQQSGALAELAGAISHSTSETQPCV